MTRWGRRGTSHAGPPVSELIDVTNVLLKTLGIHPLGLTVDGGAARLLAAMPDSALRTRSRGPYTPDDLPPEAVATVNWVDLRLYLHPDQPEFTIEGGGTWPRLSALFTAGPVLVTFVVPEDAPEVYTPEPGHVTLETDIQMALGQLAKSLRAAARDLGAEPPVALSLGYPDDPNYEESTKLVPDHLRYAFPNVMPTVEVDRSRCSRDQRAAHDRALRATAYRDQRVEPLGRTGFTVRVGTACLRDLGA